LLKSHDKFGLAPTFGSLIPAMVVHASIDAVEGRLSWFASREAQLGVIRNRNAREKSDASFPAASCG